MQSALRSETTYLTYEQFLQMKSEDTHAEWVDGEVSWFMPPERTHQQVLRFLSYLLEEYLHDTGLGEFLFAPFELFLTRSNTSREPDLDSSASREPFAPHGGPRHRCHRRGCRSDFRGQCTPR